MYWRSLEKLTQTPGLKAYNSSFIFMDSDAWIWSVELYRFILEDYCKNLPFDRDFFRQHMMKTNHAASKHNQAKKILALLGIKDEAEEGWWLKQFRYELDKESGKSGSKDKRSFTVSERPRFLGKVVKELAPKIELTSVTLGLALISTAHIQSSDEKRVGRIFEVLPKKAEEFFLPKEKIILK